jgi:Na+-driven multidrug efflux pump
MFLSTTRQLLFLLPLLLILTPEYGAVGAWVAMPIADGASVLVAAILLFTQIRKLRRMEREMLFNR